MESFYARPWRGFTSAFGELDTRPTGLKGGSEGLLGGVSASPHRKDVFEGPLSPQELRPPGGPRLAPRVPPSGHLRAFVLTAALRRNLDDGPQRGGAPLSTTLPWPPRAGVPLPRPDSPPTPSGLLEDAVPPDNAGLLRRKEGASGASMAPSSRRDAPHLPGAASTFWALMLLFGLLLAYCSEYPKRRGVPRVPKGWRGRAHLGA